jgi:hypothetical protein
MNNEFVDLIGFESIYEINKNGDIRSKNKINKYRKPQIVTGYMQVVLFNKEIKKARYIHNLVWESFNGKIKDGLEVDHIDENKLNNHISNLRLVTHRQNRLNWVTKRNKYTGTQKANNKFMAKYRLNGKQIYLGVFNTQQEAHEQYLKAINNSFK